MNLLPSHWQVTQLNSPVAIWGSYPSLSHSTQCCWYNAHCVLWRGKMFGGDRARWRDAPWQNRKLCSHKGRLRTGTGSGPQAIVWRCLVYIMVDNSAACNSEPAIEPAIPNPLPKEIMTATSWSFFMQVNSSVNTCFVFAVVWTFPPNQLNAIVLFLKLLCCSVCFCCVKHVVCFLQMESVF